jgi:hypothetical protein
VCQRVLSTRAKIYPRALTIFNINKYFLDSCQYNMIMCQMVLNDMWSSHQKAQTLKKKTKLSMFSVRENFPPRIYSTPDKYALNVRRPPFTSHSSRSRRTSSAGPKTRSPHKHIPYICIAEHFSNRNISISGHVSEAENFRNFGESGNSSFLLMFFVCQTGGCGN